MAVVKQVLSSIESHFSALIPHHHEKLVDEIVKTHHPDGSQVDVHHLFDIVSQVLLPPQNADKETVDTETIWNFFCERMEGIPAESISKLSCEMACKCSGKDAQEKTKEMLKNYLSSYYWDAKMVIVLAAFAVNYGQFRLLTEFNNPIAKHVALLKRLQGVIKNPASYDKLLGGINELIKATLTLTRCVLQFSKYFGTSNPKFSVSTSKNVAKAAFYAIHSVLICASHISGLGLEAESRIDVTVTVSTLSTFATQIISFSQELQKHFDTCKQDQEDYISVVQYFKDRVTYKIEILKSLFHGVKSPLVVIRNHVTIEVTWEQLESKKVLLFISTYYPGIEKEIKDLAEAYLEREDTIDYRIVWFPIKITSEKHFSRMQALMPWFTVQDLSVIRGGAYRYIEKLWKKFGQKQTILLPLGEPELQESYYTIDWLWSNVLDKIELPAEDKPLPIDCVIGSLHRPSKPDGSSTRGVPAPIVCLFGGEDLKWIESFIQLIDDIKAKFTTINIELIYVSKRESIDEHYKDVFKFLESKSITYWTSNDTKCRRFWARLEVLFSTAIRNGKNTKQDIMKEMLILLGYNASTKGWAVFGHSDAKLSVKLAKATGDVAELVLKETEKWYSGGSVTDFLQKLSIQLDAKAITQPHHCCHIMLPATIGDIIPEIACPVCEKDMGNFRFYRCCV